MPNAAQTPLPRLAGDTRHQRWGAGTGTATPTPFPRLAGETRYQRWGAGRARLLPHSSLVLPGKPGTNGGAWDGHGYSHTAPSSYRGNNVIPHYDAGPVPIPTTPNQPDFPPTPGILYVIPQPISHRP